MTKTDSNELERLLRIEKQISLEAEQKMEDASAGIRAIWAMFRDLQEICESVFDVVKHVESELEEQKSVNRDMDRKLAEQKAVIEEYKKKAAYYDQLDLDSAKLASLLCVNGQEREALCAERKKLEAEREAFETERDQMISAMKSALEKVDAYKKEKDTAISSRDVAIAEKEGLQEEIEEKGREIASKEKEIESYKEDQERYKKEIVRLTEEKKDKVRTLKTELDWLRGYAEALDDKIIRYFKDDKKRELKDHYNEYLDNPDKWVEHRKHFPEFGGTEKKKEKNQEEYERSTKLQSETDTIMPALQENRWETKDTEPSMENWARGRVSKDD